MRVLFINPFAQAISGPDQSLTLLIQNLASDVEAYVWIPKGSPFQAAYQKLGAHVLTAPVPCIRRSLNPLYFLGFIFGSMLAIHRLVKLVRNHNIDLVHSNMEVILFSGMACRLAGVPHIYHVRGTSFYNPKWLGKIITTWIDRFSSRIVCISQAVADLFKSSSDKVVVAFNPVADDLFDIASANRRATLSGIDTSHYRLVVSAVGRINPRKDLETFVRAAALVNEKYPDIGFVVVGEAANALEENYLAQLRRLAENLGIAAQLHFTGQIAPIRQAYEATDIVCLCSINEGFGRVLAEAAASGKASIGSDTGGIGEVIDNGESGLLFTPGEPTSLADNIIKMIENQPMMRTMGENARARAKSSFKSSAHALAVQRIYQELSTNI